MSLWSIFRLRLKKEEFQPTLFGMAVNPAFIIRNELFKVIRSLSPNIKGKVLDFGCGSKPYEDLFEGCREYIGCDVEKSGHDHSDSKVDYFFDGKTLPFKDGEFDAVVASEVFEHVFNLPHLLDEISRVTRPSGSLLMSIPFVFGEHEVPYDYARYTSYGMTHLLESHGYQVLELKKTAPFLLTLFQLLIIYLIKHILPNNKLYHVFQFVLIFPLTVLAYIANAVFPKRYEVFCNMVILAKKRDAKK